MCRSSTATTCNDGFASQVILHVMDGARIILEMSSKELGEGGWNSSPESVIDNKDDKVSTNLGEDSGGKRKGKKEERVKQGRRWQGSEGLKTTTIIFKDKK